MNRTASAFGHIAIAPKATSKTGEAFWAHVSRVGFTAYCKAKFGEFVEADAHDGITLHQQRAEMLASLEAIRQAKGRRVLQHANVVGNEKGHCENSGPEQLTR